MASLDVRARAMEQLAVLRPRCRRRHRSVVAGQMPPQIARARAGSRQDRRLRRGAARPPPGAPRSTKEMWRKPPKSKPQPIRTKVLLVADALTGQDAVNLARAFDGPSASPASC